MTFGTKIQTFNGLHASHQSDNPNAAVDWTNNKIWFAQAPSDANFISRYGINTGVEQAFATMGSIITGLGSSGSIGLDSDGNIYMSGPNALGHGSLTKINGTTLAFIANASYPLHFGGSNTLTLKISGTQYILDQDAGGGIGALDNTQLTAGTTFSATYNWPRPDNASMCMGKAGTNFGYLLTTTNGGGGTLTKLNLSAPSSATLATFNPTDIDAAWTAINVSGMCLDQTDGNIIANLWSNAGTNNYLLKFNISSGAIIWKLALTSTDQGIGANQLAQSRILHQRLAVIQRSPFQEIIVIDTNAGAVLSTQTTGMAGFTAHVAQAYDDTSGVIIGYGDWDGTGPGSGGPSPLNGSTGPFSGWYALQVAPRVGPNPGNGNRRWLASITSKKAA